MATGSEDVRSFGDQRLSFADGCRSRQRVETLSTAVIDSAASGHFWRVADTSSALRTLLPDDHASRPMQTIRAAIDPEQSSPVGVDGSTRLTAKTAPLTLSRTPRYAPRRRVDVLPIRDDLIGSGLAALRRLGNDWRPFRACAPLPSGQLTIARAPHISSCD